MRRGIIGDVHNNLKALEQIYDMLVTEGVDEIYHCGDLIDRGDDPEGVLKFCVDKKLKGVIGNHDEAILRKHVLTYEAPRKEDKYRSYAAMINVTGATEYLLSLPPILVFEDCKTIFTHAGIDPHKMIEDQNTMCCYISMCNRSEPGMSRWWGVDRKGRYEDANRLEGWERWYNLYSFDYDVYAGHMTVKDPTRIEFPRSPGKYLTYIDTGAWYTGQLTAAIVGPNGFEKYVQTPKLREGAKYHAY